jgi:hypothetical protein
MSNQSSQYGYQGFHGIFIIYLTGVSIPSSPCWTDIPATSNRYFLSIRHRAESTRLTSFASSV